MKRQRLILLLCSMCLLFGNTSLAESQIYKSEAGSFQVELPGDITEGGRDVDSDAGITLTMHRTICEKRKSVYLVTYTDDPESLTRNLDANTFLDSILDNLVKAKSKKELSRKAVSHGDYKGKQSIVKIDKQGVSVIGQYFLIGSRLYSLVVTTERSNLGRKDFREFFDSFQLAESVGVAVITQLLNALEYNYEQDSSGQYKLTLMIDDERSQLVLITPMVNNTYDHEIYDVWSPVARFTEELSPELSASLLVRNGKVIYGSFQVLENPDDKLLVFSTKVTEAPNSSLLEKIMGTIAAIADELENEEFQSDEF